LAEEATPLFGPAPPRTMPTAVEAEQALLGSLLSNNARTAERCSFLKPEHFADPINGYIYKRAMERISGGLVADAVTLKVDFENTGVLEEYGGTKYLAQLLTCNIGWQTTISYAKAIEDTWLRRQLIDVSEEMATAAYGGDIGRDARDIVDEAAEAVMALGEHVVTKGETDFATAAAAAPARAEAAAKGEVGHARLDTGIPAIDRLWGGLWPGELYYLMARSRTGKTPCMMQIARNVAAKLAEEAVKAGKKAEQVEHVHVFSLEMTADGLITTNLASTSRWTADQIKSGDIDDWIEFEKASKALAGLPIVIDDQGDMDMPKLAMRARSVKRGRRTRLICVDYRELVRRGRDQARMGLPEWIPFLGYQLKALAKSLNLPIIALAQINKARSGETVVRPILDDLPYDGGQAADGVFALHRPELYLGDEPAAPAHFTGEKLANFKSDWEKKRHATRGLMEVGALKRRFGPANTWAKLRFDGPRMLLSEWITRDSQLSMVPPDGRWDEQEWQWAR
jgi:replicative DNA helicase